MTQRMAIGSRKGLLLYTEQNQSWRYDGVHFRGTPVTMVLRDPRDAALYAALEHGHFGPKLHRSDDDGLTWHEIATPSFPKSDAADALAVKQIWALEAAGRDQPGVIWAGTMPAAMFRSTDKGQTWELNDPFWNLPERLEWFGGGNDAPVIHSVSIHPHDSRKIALAISCGGVWQTGDGGKSWENTSKGLWAAFMPPDQRENPNVQDPHRLVRCISDPDYLYIQHHNAVFSSADGGRQWNTLSEAFGFAVAVHPQDPMTAWFIPAEKDEYRLPKDEDFCITKTEDGGRTFRRITNGLPQQPSFDLVLRHALDVDHTGDRLAFGSTTGNLWVSLDGGEGWKLLSSNLPPVYCLKML